MSKKSAIPDAWDDDWESQADKADAAASTARVEEQIKISKAERLAQHAETNKKIWESAEAPKSDYFLAARDNVPLKQEFKPALKLLSRKPVVQRVDPDTGLAKMTIDDEDDEEEQKKNQPTPEEIRLRTQREREEKQRRYDEARARILGTSSGSSTPGNATPPAENGRAVRGKGRGRGGDRQERRSDSRPATKELFDPSYSPKPGITIQKRNEEDINSGGRSASREEEQIIRVPKGPDGSGRGGMGFSNRGPKKS